MTLPDDTIPPMELYTPLADRRFFSLSELAWLCGVKPSTVLYWCRTGRITGFGRTSARGKYRIARSEVVRTLKRRGVEAPGLWTLKKRVLVIDPFPPIARLIRAILDRERIPASVSSSESVGDGIVLAGQVKPHLIFVDLEFPDSDLQGLHALFAIRQAKLLRKTKVIVMASNSGAGRRMRAAGAHAFLLKPFGPKEILGVLASLHP